MESHLIQYFQLFEQGGAAKAREGIWIDVQNVANYLLGEGKPIATEIAWDMGQFPCVLPPWPLSYLEFAFEGVRYGVWSKVSDDHRAPTSPEFLGTLLEPEIKAARAEWPVVAGAEYVETRIVAHTPTGYLLPIDKREAKLNLYWMTSLGPAPLWMRAVAVDLDTKTLFIPAAVGDEDDDEGLVVAAAAYSGISIALEHGHAYVPARWIADVYCPEFKPIANLMLGRLMAEFEKMMKAQPAPDPRDVVNGKLDGHEHSTTCIYDGGDPKDCGCNCDWCVANHRESDYGVNIEMTAQHCQACGVEWRAGDEKPPHKPDCPIGKALKAKDNKLAMAGDLKK